MSTIGFVGFGVVGQATAKGFKTKHTILSHDKFKTSDTLDKVIAESEFIFLCLPTPMTGDYSRIDLTILEEAVHQIAPKIAGTDKILVIKSTVVPGTTARFAKTYPKTHFAMNPEFLREKTAEWDFMNPDRIIIGSNDPKVAKRFEELYRGILPNVPVFHSDPTSAEMVKYMANTFLAMKVLFANEIAELCRKVGVDYDTVKKMVVSDTRIGDSHLDVSPEKGFGGKCFPKDTVALLGLAKDVGIDLSLLKTMWEKNLRIRSVRDWEEIEGAVSEKRATL
ncbi:MAG TPA: nucleotide sugar dehydrogenase [bacterium]|nr:nucleotide sugar dehydrogenase [bacterium]